MSFSPTFHYTDTITDKFPRGSSLSRIVVFARNDGHSDGFIKDHINVIGFKYHLPHRKAESEFSIWGRESLDIGWFDEWRGIDAINWTRWHLS